MAEIILSAIILFSGALFIGVYLSLANITKREERNENEMSKIVFIEPEKEKTISHSLNAVA